MSRLADRGSRTAQLGDLYSEQVRRLARLKRAPGSLDEHLRVLRRSCRNAAHAQAVIDRIMDTCRECPAPVEIVAVSEQVEVPVPSSERPVANARGVCEECTWGPYGSAGWRPVFLLVECRGGIPISGGKRERVTGVVAAELRGKLNPMAQAIYESIEPCGCAGGRARGEPFPVVWGQEGLDLSQADGLLRKLERHAQAEGERLRDAG